VTLRRAMTGRHLFAVTSAITIAMWAVLAGTVAVRAGTQQGMTVAPNGRASQSYPPLVGTFPSTAGVPFAPDPDPGTCASAPSCDVIPLTVIQPDGLGIFDDFSIEVTLSWTASAGDDDLNLYLWYDPPQSSYAASSSVTSHNPESLRFASPTSGKFSIVVTNASGVNTGYAVTARSIYSKGQPPPELAGAPAAGQPGTAPQFATQGPSAATGPRASFAAPTFVGPGETPPSIAEPGGVATPGPDPRLAALDPSVAAGLAGTPRLFRESPTLGRPRPVSPQLLVFWTVAFPLLLLVAAAVAFRRSRPVALTARAKVATRP